MSNRRDIEPIHPGEILMEDFMRPVALVTADKALRLARYFGTDAQSWLNIQSHYDLEIALDQLGDRLKTEVQPRAA